MPPEVVVHVGDGDGFGQGPRDGCFASLRPVSGPLGPGDEHIAVLAVGAGGEGVDVRLGPAGNRPSAQALAAGQKAADGRQRDIAGPGRQVQPQQAELDLARLMVVAQDEVEVPLGAGEEAARIRLRHEFGLLPFALTRQLAPGFGSDVLQAPVALGHPDGPAARGGVHRLPQTLVRIGPVVRVDVVRLEVGPRFVRQDQTRVQHCRGRRRDVPADDQVRVARLEAQIRRLLIRAHLVGGVAAEGRDVGLVPRLPRLHPAFVATRHFPAEPKGIAQIDRVAAPQLAVLDRPFGRAMKDLEHLESVPGLQVGGGVVRRRRVHETSRLRLDVTPPHPVANPVDARQRRQAGELLLFGRVVGREPRGGRIDADRRVLRHRRRRPGEHRRRRPREALIVLREELDSIPPDVQRADFDGWSGRMDRARSHLETAVVQNAPSPRRFGRDGDRDDLRVREHCGQASRTGDGPFDGRLGQRSCRDR